MIEFSAGRWILGGVLLTAAARFLVSGSPTGLGRSRYLVYKNVPLTIGVIVHQVGSVGLEDDEATTSAEMRLETVSVTLGMDTGCADFLCPVKSRKEYTATTGIFSAGGSCLNSSCVGNSTTSGSSTHSKISAQPVALRPPGGTIEAHPCISPANNINNIKYLVSANTA